MRRTSTRLKQRVALLVAVLLTGAWWGPPALMAAGENDFVGLTPCRAVDTRGNGFGGAFGPPALPTGVPRDFPLQGQCGIPATATAVSLNVTATNTVGPGFFLLHPQGGAQPVVSTLNYLAGGTVANAALVPLGPGGLTVVAGVSGADLILDVNGYFTDSLVHGVGDNLFVGAGAGNVPTVGNTAVGTTALTANTAGQENTAIGHSALFFNVDGDFNVAVGSSAAASNTSGQLNTAVGANALGNNTTGTNNTAIGNGAGSLMNGGNSNIFLGAQGQVGDTLTMRLGSVQTKTFIVGVRGTTTANNNAGSVLIDSAGQLGTINSSRRLKTDIEPVGDRSRGLHTLRPVSFRYRVHPPDGPVDYGLIAEEVAEVYPELVVRDAEGAPETVRYHLLPALLLSELQRLGSELQAERAQRIELAATLAELAAEVARLKHDNPMAAGRSVPGPSSTPAP
jgi:endosialidase-like protein